jgi:hypothetical protein
VHTVKVVTDLSSKQLRHKARTETDARVRSAFDLYSHSRGSHVPKLYRKRITIMMSR